MAASLQIGPQRRGPEEEPLGQVPRNSDVCSQTQLVSGCREEKEQRMGFNPFAVAVTTHPRLGICKRARYFWISVSSGSVGQGKDEVR